MKGGDLIITRELGVLDGLHDAEGSDNHLRRRRVMRWGTRCTRERSTWRGNIGSLGSDAKEETPSEDELLRVWETLENFGITERFQFKKVVSAKKLYHFDALERFEKRVV